VTGAAIPKVGVNVTRTPALKRHAAGILRRQPGSSPFHLTQRVVPGPTATSFMDYPVTPGAPYDCGIQPADTGGNISPMSAVAKITSPN